MGILQGAILGAFILGMVGIVWFKTYPKEVKDLECSRCFCNETCSKLVEEKKPSGRKFFVED
jgi:hypothetical protein